MIQIDIINVKTDITLQTSNNIIKLIFEQKINSSLMTSTQKSQQAIIPRIKNEINDQTVLLLLWKVIERMRLRGDDMTLQCLLNQEKLIHLSIIAINKKTYPSNPLFSLQKEIFNFVQKINKVTMQNFKEENQNVDIKIFSKAVDILMHPQAAKIVKDLHLLGKIKVLTFNNLACIYKKKKKFGIALRSVTFALQIQQGLLSWQQSQQKYQIIPTYLNKAAILSQMGKHPSAIQQILKSKKFIQKIQLQLLKQISQAQSKQDQGLKKRLQEKRYYGVYMKMIINYNMGAEKEHMKQVDQAVQYYRTGRQLAAIINNQFMTKKFDDILAKISTK